MKHILQCPLCKSYGMSSGCDCGGKRQEPRPPKYNPVDKYAHYRMIAKKIDAQKTNAQNDTR